MTRRVAVVDHGMGNLRSVAQAVKHVSAGTDWEVVIAARPEQVASAERVVLPGQGAMRNARANALNTVSHWWWALSPCRLSMCTVTSAWLAKP